MNEENFCKKLLIAPFLLEDYLLSKGYIEKVSKPFYTTGCQRCKKPNKKYFTVSRFNSDFLCQSCDKREKTHPEYNDTKVREFYAVKIGITNYCQPVPKDLLLT